MLQHSTDAAIRDTIAAVFRGAEFNSGKRETIGAMLLRLFSKLLNAIGDAADRWPILPWLALAVVLGIALAILGRAAYLAYRRAQLSAEARRLGLTGGTDGGDPLARALALAEAGNYTDAAHSLYSHLITRLASRQWVRPHPSKTVGDYGRELRSGFNSAFPAYRDFARSYEHVIYGSGSCDRARFEQLRSMVDKLTYSHG